MATQTEITLEIETKNFIDKLQASGAPPINRLSPTEARAVLEKVQSQPVEKSSVKTHDKVIPGGPQGEVSIHIIRPANIEQPLATIMYFHGAGWVMGSKETHDHLMREIANGTQAAVVYVNYSLSPEARFPTAIEEAYAATKYIAEHGKELNLNTQNLAVAGDSVGGNMAIAVTFLAKERKGPKITSQVLFYPVTSADLNTPSYHQFAEGPWLTKAAMEWFWDAYEANHAARKNPLMSPLKAPIDQLKGLPPALVITAENDVLRDEGEEYAHRLMQAGVHVVATRFLGTTHDFVMLHALAKTPAAQGAIALANTFLKRTLKLK